jgi:large subunit ribosomal protein L33
MSPSKFISEDFSKGMSAKAKAKTLVVRLLSSAGTGFFYITSRRRNLPHKLALMKFDPIVNKHVLFNESKK